MSRAIAFLLATVGAWLLTGGVPASAAARAPSALPRGAAVVIVAPAKPTAEDLESEAYADWAEYLNGYAATKRANPPLVRMTAARWRQIARQPALTDDYATVFVRRDGTALVHGGMVLEPQVYESGAAWITGARVADMAAHGFTAARLIRRR